MSRGYLSALKTSRPSGDQYTLTNHQGTPQVTMSASGSVVGSGRYTPWGEALGSTTPDPLGFTGELQNAATGLVYLRARWYNPETGTFLGRDPFDGMQDQPYSQHPYQYSYSSPLMYTDPTGMCADADHCYPSDLDRNDPYDAGYWFIWQTFNNQYAAADGLHQFTVSDLEQAQRAYREYMANPHLYPVDYDVCGYDVRYWAETWSQNILRQGLVNFTLDTQEAEIALEKAYETGDTSLILHAIADLAEARGVSIIDVPEFAIGIAGIGSGLAFPNPCS